MKRINSSILIDGLIGLMIMVFVSSFTNILIKAYYLNSKTYDEVKYEEEIPCEIWCNLEGFYDDGNFD